MVSTSDGSAKTGSDYVGLTNYPVTILADNTNADITIDIMDDGVRESLQYFVVVFSAGNDQEEIGSRRSMRVYIEDDEGRLVSYDRSYAAILVAIEIERQLRNILLLNCSRYYK